LLFTVAAVTGLQAADLVCYTRTTISSPITYDNVTVQRGCVLTVDAALPVNLDMDIESGGLVDGLGDAETLGSGQCAERSRPELCVMP